MRSYTWVWENHWRGLWGHCLNASWWMYSPATQHREMLPCLHTVVVVYCLTISEMAETDSHMSFKVSGYLPLLYPGRSHNSESSRHTACSWASTALQRPRSCTRPSRLWAHHVQGCPAFLGCRWFQGYPLCQGCLLAPACNCHTGEIGKRGSSDGSWQ